MLGFAPSVADDVLNALCRGGSFTGPTKLYVQLHVGEPGSDGTRNVAFNELRKPVSFAASTAGLNISTNDLKWTNVPDRETYNFFSVWDDLTAGRFMFSGTMTPTSVEDGYNFTIPAGSEFSTLNVAS